MPAAGEDVRSGLKGDVPFGPCLAQDKKSGYLSGVTHEQMLLSSRGLCALQGMKGLPAE